jgi:UDP-N-acetylmuramoyl-tripeptide--D-alanyl-D-alanine ligase
MALEVLNTMSGKKIIITPGMIELGDKQYEYNRQFGIDIAGVCDEVILIGREQTKPINDGLESKKYDKEHIHIINDVKQAFEIIKKLKDNDTYVLLENDLPDIFNE